MSVTSPIRLATVNLLPQATDIYTGNGNSYDLGAEESVTPSEDYVTELAGHMTRSAGHMTLSVVGPRPTAVPEMSELPTLHNAVPPTLKGLEVRTH